MGFVPDSVVRSFGSVHSPSVPRDRIVPMDTTGHDRDTTGTGTGTVSGLAQDLVTAGLWTERDNGFQIHDYGRYNPDEKRREYERLRKREQRKKQRELSHGTERDRAGQDRDADADKSPRARAFPLPLPNSLSLPPTPLEKMSPGTTPGLANPDAQQILEHLRSLPTLGVLAGSPRAGGHAEAFAAKRLAGLTQEQIHQALDAAADEATAALNAGQRWSEEHAAKRVLAMLRVALANRGKRPATPPSRRTGAAIPAPKHPPIDYEKLKPVWEQQELTPEEIAEWNKS